MANVRPYGERSTLIVVELSKSRWRQNVLSAAGVARRAYL